MKLTGTNRPTTYTTQHTLHASTMWFPTNNPGTNNRITRNQHRFVTKDFPHHPPRCVTGNKVTAAIAWGKRPDPFRTRKLRPTAPMVLHPTGCGRVGHRRTTIQVEGPPTRGALPHLNPPNNRHHPASTSNYAPRALNGPKIGEFGQKSAETRGISFRSGCKLVSFRAVACTHAACKLKN